MIHPDSELRFEQVARERMVMVVTHRLASVARADRIFVLDRGRLVEEQTASEPSAYRAITRWCGRDTA